MKVVVDAEKGSADECAEIPPFLIKPNNHELGEIFRTTITDKNRRFITVKSSGKWAL